jgi:ArsR family transcriptional regulator, lead/cadmium/zinc/bismuth-responsive transcriptional repressor
MNHSIARLNKLYNACVYNNDTEEKLTRGCSLIRNDVSSKRPVNIFEKIEESLERLNEKMEVMIELQRNSGGVGSGVRSVPAIPDASLDVMTLLSMPDHLRKTAMTICRLGRATAEEISEQTERARAVESAYLNQLVLMGYLKKERKGRKAYFYVDRESQS